MNMKRLVLAMAAASGLIYLPANAASVSSSTSIFNDWNSGFCASVNVYNPDAYWRTWNLNFDAMGEIFTTWDATSTQSSGSVMASATGSGWTTYIAPNGSVKFGYCANRIAPVEEPVGVVPLADGAAPLVAIPQYDNFAVGFGGSSSFPFASQTDGETIWVSSVDLVLDDYIEYNGYYQKIKNFDANAFDQLQQKLKNSQYLVYWITKGWQPSWFDLVKIQRAMDAGYTPVFNYWYFGDTLGDGMPSADAQALYQQDQQRLIDFLNQLNGTKLIVMEPEFNKSSIVDQGNAVQRQFAEMIAQAIDTVRAGTSDTYFSLAMTDAGRRSVNSVSDSCGYSNCALGDQASWDKTEAIYNALTGRLDFISFQQMVGQFSRDPSNPGGWNTPNPIAYSNEDLGVAQLASRIANLSQYLSDKYNRPVFLPYIAIASATWSDVNADGIVQSDEVDKNGWEIEAQQVYSDLSAMKPGLLQNGLFGMAAMGLFDNPRQDYGGYQYFMQNEYHLGIMKTSAVDEVDVARSGDIVSKGRIVDSLFAQ